jgi:hypothetical protein
LKQIDLFNGSKHCSQSIRGPIQIHWLNRRAWFQSKELCQTSQRHFYAWAS